MQTFFQSLKEGREQPVRCGKLPRKKDRNSAFNKRVLL